jgi:hypothetical protein
MSYGLATLLTVLLVRSVPGRLLQPRTIPPEIVARLHAQDSNTLFWVDPAFDGSRGFQVEPPDDRYPTENDSLPWDLKVEEVREALFRSLGRLHRPESPFIFKSTLTYANRHCGFIGFFGKLTMEGRVVTPDGRVWAVIVVHRGSMGEYKQVLENSCKEITNALEEALLKPHASRTLVMD